MGVSVGSIGLDGLRIDEKNENERRKVSDSIKDRGTSKPNHQRSAAATDHYHHPAPCHWQRGILRQRGQLEIDGRTIQAETKAAVLQLHDAVAVLVVSVVCGSGAPTTTTTIAVGTPIKDSRILSRVFLSFFISESL